MVLGFVHYFVFSSRLNGLILSIGYRRSRIKDQVLIIEFLFVTQFDTCENRVSSVNLHLVGTVQHVGHTAFADLCNLG